MSKKALRIVLKQNKAHYRRGETLDNKMTYPLPPFSTVIGAIHNACGYKEYRPMDISIQGDFESMSQEVYRDICFLNSTMDDRGNLVKLKSPDKLNDGYEIIASALKSQGNSFKKKITISINNEKELDEYIRISSLKDQFQEEKKLMNKNHKELKQKVKTMKKELKLLDKKSEEHEKLKSEISSIEEKIKKEKDEFESKKYSEYTYPMSLYANITTGLKRYEVLYGVNLVIHVRSDEKTLSEIEDNVLNLTAIGRSEDFVEIIDCSEVEIFDDYTEISKIKDILNCEINRYSGYIDFKAIAEEVIYYDEYSKNSSCKSKKSIPTKGTSYYLNKNYTLSDNKRLFEKKKVVYLNGYSIDEDEELESFNEKYPDSGVYLDENGYVVSFL